MSNTKNATRKVLLDLYKNKGASVAISVARELLTSDVRGKMSSNKIAEFKTAMNGEMGEVVLEILIRDYCAQHPRQTSDWFWSKSLILKDPSSNTDFLTELDFTLFTPECIYLFECKSYSGDKQLVDNGKLIRSNGNSCDVYKQNLLHAKTLDKNLKHLAAKPIYRMVMFNFSEGEMKDCRTEQAKFSMPCVTDKDWQSVLITGTPVWNLKNVKPVISTIEKASKNLRDKHLKYVKSLERHEDE